MDLQFHWYKQGNANNLYWTSVSQKGTVCGSGNVFYGIIIFQYLQDTWILIIVDVFIEEIVKVL